MVEKNSLESAVEYTPPESQENPSETPPQAGCSVDFSDGGVLIECADAGVLKKLQEAASDGGLIFRLETSEGEEGLALAEGKAEATLEGEGPEAIQENDPQE